MAEAKDVKISIGGKTITLSGDVSEEYSSRLAEYLNGKRKSFLISRSRSGQRPWSRSWHGSGRRTAGRWRLSEDS